MADRTLTWSAKRCDGNPTVMLPAYYMEAEYIPVAVRIHADSAPDIGDAIFEIYDDGVSIMNDHSYNYETYIANTAAYTGSYTIYLPMGADSDEMAEDFNYSPIDIGSWVTCSIRSDGGAKNLTIQLDLEKVSEPDEDLE